MTEDNLRDRLRRADPAASLPPLPPETARRLVDNAVDVTVPRPSLRRRLPVLVGAAALVALTAALITTNHPQPVALPNAVDQPARSTVHPAPSSSAPRPPSGTAPTTGRPQPGTSWATPPPTPTTTIGQPVINVLTSGEDADGRCPRPEAQYLAATATLAFQGTVTKIEGNVVTLRVLGTWRGAAADLAEVRNTTKSPVLAGFEPQLGQTYLVAAANGQVIGCGYSGPDEPDLRTVYDQAF